MTQTPQPENRTLVVGHLAPQLQHGTRQLVTDTYTPVGGRVRQFVLRVASPFSGMCALPIILDDQATGAELLTSATADARIAATGRIEWLPPPPSAAGSHLRHGEMRIRALHLRAATDADQTGADVWFEGVVQKVAHFAPHPQRPSLMLALTTIQIDEPIARPGSRSTFRASHFIPVAIPLTHADTPNMLGKGNRVRIEGMIERVAINISTADGAKSAPSGTTSGETDDVSHTGEATPRQRPQRYLRSRVVAGFVELIKGEPVSTDDARRLIAARRETRVATKTQ